MPSPQNPYGSYQPMAYRPVQAPPPPRNTARNVIIISCVAAFLGLTIILGLAGQLNSPPAARHPAAASPAKRPAMLVTGYGATEAAWNSRHTPDHDFAAGSVYDPDPSLPRINGHPGAVYVLVTVQDGRVLSYAMNLHPGTALHAAVEVARAQFPPDARLLWTVRRGMCAQAQFASAALGSVLAAPRIGDPSGRVLVEFEDIAASGSDVSSPRTFNSASFDLGGTASPAGSPGC